MNEPAVDVASPTTDALRFGLRPTPGPGHAAAIAVLVARDWLGGAAPRLGTGFPSQDATTYVEHVAVEEVDLADPPYAIVTLSAVVLEAREATYRDARGVRLAVPVVLTHDAARPAGEPWLLSPPALEVALPDWRTVDDPDLAIAAGAALAAAGYREVAVVAVERGVAHRLRVVATAVAPGEADASEHHVWLRERLGELVVAGTLPAASPSPVPSASPGRSAP